MEDSNRHLHACCITNFMFMSLQTIITQYIPLRYFNLVLILEFCLNQHKISPTVSKAADEFGFLRNLESHNRELKYQTQINQMCIKRRLNSYFTGIRMISFKFNSSQLLFEEEFYVFKRFTFVLSFFFVSCGISSNTKRIFHYKVGRRSFIFLFSSSSVILRTEFTMN